MHRTIKTTIQHVLLTMTLLVALRTGAQTTKEDVFKKIEKTGGVLYAYPEDEIKPLTPPPAGYQPFYISHFGRHGSRYLISDSEYEDMIVLFELGAKNNALTSLGADVLRRLRLVWEEAKWEGGNLSPVGVREQRRIAERMYKAYPEVFTAEGKFSACATTIIRCIFSMDVFCERLKEFNPALTIPRSAGPKWQQFLNHHTPQAIAFRSESDTWKKEYDLFVQQHVRPERLLRSLFTNTRFFEKNMNDARVMWAMYSIANGMQNIETQLSFYDIFTPQELFDLWQCKNYKTYVADGNSALSKGIMMDNAKPVLKNMLDSIAVVIAAKGKGADFRFAHDGNIIPLAMLLHLDSCYTAEADPKNFYKVWSTFKVAPMSGNIQLVFFRKENAEDILVKFLLHEKEVLVPPVKSNQLPYYRWEDVQQFYSSLLK